MAGIKAVCKKKTWAEDTEKKTADRNFEVLTIKSRWFHERVNSSREFTFTEDALQISTATHNDTSCACSKSSSKAPSLLGSLTYKFCSHGRGPWSDPVSSEMRRLPVLKPKMLSRSLEGDWLLPTPMPYAREFKKWIGWIRKNKSWKTTQNRWAVLLKDRTLYLLINAYS